MAVFKGSAGIKELRKQTKQKVQYFVKTVAVDIVEEVIQQPSKYSEKIVGMNEYPTKDDGVVVFSDNDPGQFINSWHTDQSQAPMGFERIGNAGGIDSISQALLLSVDLSKPIYIENTTEQAANIEIHGWDSVNYPERADAGWRDKQPYRPVEKTSLKIPAIIQKAFLKARAFGGED